MTSTPSLPKGSGTRELYWFQADLRLEDNPGLLQHANGSRLLCVYCLQDNPAWCNTVGMGPQRRRFLLESLTALHRQLESLGQTLLVIPGDPRTIIPLLVNKYRVQRVGTSYTAGFYEARQRAYLARNLPVPVLVHPANTLFDERQLAGGLDGLPGQFTGFRRMMEHQPVAPPVGKPVALPPVPEGVYPGVAPAAEARPALAFPVRGGSLNGQQRLGNFLYRRRAVDTYAETRNALQGEYASSGLSPWLANGCLSVRSVAHALMDYEQTICRNESTRWLYQELLWREYFHWRERIDRNRLFAATGIARKRHLRTFEPRAYARWCQGDTDFPLVNALMRQLCATGFMSNRGRQIAASCLVNELNLDWRYGAAFFEKHLVDFDLASNYGNWQYIAGVGCDPRGGRHFNLEKQAQLYDPDGTFTQTWGGFRPRQPEYVTDAADWPIGHGGK
ncbi:MAG: DASH family cryptochrome [Halieaceae bacterium]|jgi:deoxyribodipyrimidine photo-lyase|nr:DASH family cryptochrome [Halieaceae bacterium]